jgi:ATP-dependent DNA helicase Q4
MDGIYRLYRDMSKQKQVPKVQVSKAKVTVETEQVVSDEEVAATPKVKKEYRLFQDVSPLRELTHRRAFDASLNVKPGASVAVTGALDDSFAFVANGEERHVLAALPKSPTHRRLTMPVFGVGKKSPMGDTPKKVIPVEDVTFVDFKSPVARAGGGMRLANRRHTVHVPRSLTFLQSPEKDLARKSDDETAKQSEEATIKEAKAGGGEEEYQDDFDPVAMSRKKKPIMGKRQTSKRKLEPVFQHQEVVVKKKARASGSGPSSNTGGGVRLRLGKKGRYIDHSLVDRGIVDRTRVRITAPKRGKAPKVPKLKADGKKAETSVNMSEEVVDEDSDQEDGIPELPDQDKDEAGPDLDDDAIQEQEVVQKSSSMDLSEETLLKVCAPAFQIKAFRPGQYECIKRVMEQKSSLLILPTGGGKSLCYMAPALLFQSGITIIVSPMISLMTDQVSHLPKELPGAFLNSSQTPSEWFKTRQAIRAGRVRLLFVSPETACSQSFTTFMKSTGCQVHLMCVDEAHCLSEWSHNFRPAYFHLRGVFEQLKVGCVLAVTASATIRTRKAICNYLGIDTERDVLAYPPFRSNLELNVSVSTKKKDDVIRLLSSPKFRDLQSVIVYVMRQREADEVAETIRTRLRVSAESYHAGKDSAVRQRVQADFMSGKTRVICATIAFGLGINKPDIRAVIHYSLPKSIENFVQETGRCGRDGEQAWCHLLLNDDDYYRLRSLACTDAMDMFAAKKLVELVYQSPRLKIANDDEMVLLDLDKAENQMDLRASVVHTLLYYLQQRDDPLIKVHPSASLELELVMYQGKMSEVMKKDEFLASIGTLATKTSPSHFRFSVLDVCRKMKLTPSELTDKLMESRASNAFNIRKHRDAACFTLVKRQLQPDDWLPISEYLDRRAEQLKEDTIKKVDQVYALMKEAAHSPQSVLRRGLQEYFSMDDGGNQYLDELVDTHSDVVNDQMVKNEACVKQEIKSFLLLNTQMRWTARSIARIFHGIASPRYRYEECCRMRQWGRYQHIDFTTLFTWAHEALRS